MIAEWLSQLTPENAYPIVSAFAILVVAFSLSSSIEKNHRRIKCIERALGLDSLDLPANVGAETSAENTTQGQPDGGMVDPFRPKTDG